ncbi:MAG: DrmB family protein, partial [Aridibacter sp.]
VGATLDLPNISVMIMGLHEWNKDLCIPINEGRLLSSVQEVLGSHIQELRQPPFAKSDITISAFDPQNLEGVPVAPFPNWVVCPKCRLLAPLQKDVFEFQSDRFRPDRNAYTHALCRGVTKGPKVLPTRFIAVCPKGHIDDFPWHYFVHGGNSNCNGSLRLRDLKKYGTPSDLLVYCEGCDTERPLVQSIGIKGKESMPTCRGRHPHLRSFEESCDEQLKTVTLGASNTWFGISLSVLTIPTQESELEELLDQNWKTFEKINNLETFEIVFDSMLSIGQLQDFLKFSKSEIWEKIENRHQNTSEVSTDEQITDLKLPEWHTLTKADPSKNSLNFSLRKTKPPKGFEGYFEKTVIVERLREVRALVGFTRLEAAEVYEDLIGDSDIERVPLYRGNSSWTLATEVRGEGIFLEFKEGAIEDWAKRFKDSLSGLERTGFDLHQKWREARFYEEPSAHYKGVRFLLLHSFSHALMRQLALECGYASASLSERIYCHSVDEDEKIAGVLVYTSSSDSEGTLGGLSSLGEPGILGRHIAQALEEMEMCSSDPLCAEHEATQDETSLHWAACHACLFSPETSCESGNRNLDRAVLVETIRKTDYPFFNLK